MNMDDIELKLLAGLPIEIEGVGKIYSPLVKDVIQVGQEQYGRYLSYLLIDKDKAEIDKALKEKLSTFELLALYCYHDENFRNIFFNALKFMFKEEVHLSLSDSDVFFYFGKIDDRRFITRENIELIQAIVRVANQVKVQEEDEDEYRPANEEARRIIEEMLARRKNKPKPKPPMNLHSIISGLAWKSNSINIFNISELTIYQLYDGFHRQESIDSYHYTLVGIYSGNVDGKKINYKDLHWTKILKQD